MSDEGKHKWTSGFRIRGDAQRALREAISSHENGTRVEPSKLTYRQYVESIWLGLLDDQ